MLDLQLIDEAVRQQLEAQVPELAGSVDTLNSEEEIDKVKKRWPSASVLVRGGRFQPPPGNAKHQEADVDVLVYLRTANVSHEGGAAASGALALVTKTLKALSFFEPLPSARLEAVQFGVYRLTTQSRAVFAVHFSLITEFCS